LSICVSSREWESGGTVDNSVRVSTTQNRIASAALVTALAAVTIAISFRARARRKIRLRRAAFDGGGSPQ
jgi:hypothetical protein